jgi:tetratricopeptide (TPR) repeat protein
LPGDDNAKAVVAVFASSWIKHPPIYEAWRNTFALEMGEAVPLNLGSLSIDDQVRFSDSNSGSTIPVPMDSGVGFVVAWVGPVPDFSAVANGDSNPPRTLRPLAFGIYEGDLAKRVEALCTNLSENEHREVVAELWGWPTQIHASHRVARSPSEMEKMTCQELLERVGTDVDHPRYPTLVSRQIIHDHFSMLEENAPGSPALHDDGWDHARAQALLLFGYYPEGKSLLRELITAGDGDAYVELLRWSLTLLDDEELSAPIPTTVTLSPDQFTEVEKFRASIGLIQAQRALAEGDTLEARNLLEKAQEQGLVEANNLLESLGSSENIFASAWIKYRNGDKASAIAEFRAALEANPGEAAYSLGLINHLDGNITEALIWWKGAADSGSTEAAGSLAEHYFDIGDSNQGRIWAERGANLGDARCMLALGRSFWFEGQNEEGSSWIVKSAEAGNVEAMDFYGQLLHSQGESKEAFVYLNRAALEAQDPFAVANSANTLAFSYLIPEGKLEQAEVLLRRAIEVDAGEASVNAMSNLGILFYERGDYKEALDIFSEVLEAESGPFDEANEYIARIKDRIDLPAQAPTSGGMNFCPECGSARGTQHKFCGGCGFSFPL